MLAAVYTHILVFVHVQVHFPTFCDVMQQLAGVILVHIEKLLSCLSRSSRFFSV